MLTGLIKGIGDSVRVAWWLYLLIAIIIVARLSYVIYKWKRLSKAGMYEIDKMSGDEFEKFLLTLFLKLGNRAQIVGSHKGDYGTDLIIEKGGVRTAVQAKRWKSTVGEKAVQEVYSSLKLRNCTKALVVTNRYFSYQAKILARSNDVELWDRDVLIEKILQEQ